MVRTKWKYNKEKTCMLKRQLKFWCDWRKTISKIIIEKKCTDKFGRCESHNIDDEKVGKLQANDNAPNHIPRRIEYLVFRKDDLELHSQKLQCINF